MLVLCRTVHNLFGLPSEDRRRPPPPHCCRNIPPLESGGLRLISGDSPPLPRNQEVHHQPSDRPHVDPGSRGLHDLCYGEIGLCTESIGSESCCDDGAEAEAEMEAKRSRCGDEEKPRGWNRKRRTEKRRFPPPLPWLDGQRSLFMRAEREHGRFRLTEVRIERRPELFRASREGGRLRLDLIDDQFLEDERVDDDGDDDVVFRRGFEMEKSEEVASAVVGVGVGVRCQEVVGGEVAMWLNSRYVTTA